MRIMMLVGHPDSPPVVGLLARGLASREHSVSVVVPAPGRLSEMAMRDGIAHYFVNVRSSLTTNSFAVKRLIDVSAMAELRRLFRSEKPDIIGLHLLRGRVLGRLASVAWGPRVVSTVHGLDLDHEGYACMDRLTRWIDSMTVAVSADTQAYMLAKGYDSRKVSTIHNGFDIREADAVQCQRGSIRAGLAISPDQPVIGMVAYMYPHVKGHETFLRAAKLVHQENPYVRFAILGGPLYNVDQWYEKSLHDLSENLGLKDSVMFIGNQPSALPFMDAMDIIVLPSNVREGFGMVLVEAMSRRKPVIGSRIGGIPEVVDDGVTGVLVPPGQERDLASAMLGLIGNPQLMTAMGVQGRLRAETHFSLDRMVDRYEEQYMAVVSGEEVVC